MKKLKKLTRKQKEYLEAKGLKSSNYLLERKGVDEFGYNFFQVMNIEENKLERFYTEN